MRRFQFWLQKRFADEPFLAFLGSIENLVSKLLSLALVIVIFAALIDLGVYLWNELLTPELGSFSRNLIEVFGIFLNILIALELLENVKAYMEKHVLHVELVVVTALIAVARKLITLDLTKVSGFELVGLSTAILSLAGSYWVIRRLNRRRTRS